MWSLDHLWEDDTQRTRKENWQNMRVKERISNKHAWECRNLPALLVAVKESLCCINQRLSRSATFIPVSLYFTRYRVSSHRSWQSRVLRKTLSFSSLLFWFLSPNCFTSPSPLFVPLLVSFTGKEEEGGKTRETGRRKRERERERERESN